MLKTKKSLQPGPGSRFTATFLFVLASVLSVHAQSDADGRATSNPPKIFTVVEQPPTFPGGNEALQKYLDDHLKLPADAGKKSKKRWVLTRFVITETGDIESIEVLKAKNDAVAAEVVKVIENMPAWLPAKQRGRTVSFRYDLPVQIR
ncbi:energy transducer TonB [Dyadobacter sp. CY323]|uniref:energy transducer TonB n=1 Tax=Dyadobacter sp. CY323 TaxID=2907302 RepID=UPI001F3A20DB|nr:energy transducer TonB [Dyadobacter sp. CY323]MCE6991192.1 energy transducer TonB [Dyadobacter sp. CY323]